MRASRIPALLLGLVLGVAACTGSSGQVAEEPQVADGTAGEGQDASADADQEQSGEGQLPEATFATLADPETTVSTSDWRGTPTVVNFWATWCGFCTEEMPDLQAAFEQLDDQVRFVGIDRQDPRDAALAFVEETGVTYDQVSSPEGEYFTQVRARGMPTTLFVDADGQIQHRHTGPLDTEQVLELVDEHLGVAA